MSRPTAADATALGTGLLTPPTEPSGVGRMHAATTYDLQAPHYDLLTAHHRYEEWTSDLEAIAVAAGLRGERLLDVACGTGKSFMPFVERGYTVTACDISPAMLALAAAKAGDRASLSVQDMRALPRLGSFDLVLCLDDALNYCRSSQELIASFTGMRRNLAPGGLLMFDVNSLMTYRTFFAACCSVVQDDGVILVWTGQGSAELKPGGFTKAECLALERTADGGWTRRVCVHRQRHFPREVVEDALRTAGLSCVGIHAMKPPSDEPLPDGAWLEEFDELTCGKAVYVARRM